MKTKCLLCSFLKNIWVGISKELKGFLDFRLWGCGIALLSFSFIAAELWIRYSETIKLLAFWFCFIAGILVIVITASFLFKLLVVDGIKWLILTYNKSKEECE